LEQCIRLKQEISKEFAIVTGGLTGQSNSEIAENIYSGQRIGKNAAENNYLTKTAEVEKGDTLTSITEEINDYFGTDLTTDELAEINNIEDLDKILVGDQVKVGAIDPKTEAVWQMFYENPDRVDVEFWNGLSEEQQKIVHYGRRIFEHDDLPKNTTELQSELNQNLWNNNGESIAHNIGATGNTDYRGQGARSNQQAIYNLEGLLVTTPENAGSYDYIEPSQSIKDHFAVDVNPWKKWGNSPQDTTTGQERLNSLDSDILGKIGNFLYGDQ